jgi:phosphatidylglycerol:prolipoprotein diacylglycerol transferase
VHPIILELGPLKIHAYGAMLAVAFVVGMWLASREARRLGEDPEQVSNISFWIILSAIVGSRLFHVVVFWHELAEPRLLSAFKIWEGGLVYYGGLLFAVTASVVYCRVKNFDFWQMGDIIAPSIALGLVFGRLGCTLVGCCFGKVCPEDFWGALVFPPQTIGLPGVPLYPTQPAEALGCLLIFAFLWTVLRHRRTFRGQVLFSFLVLYSVLRFILEFWRADPRGFSPLFTFHASPGLAESTSGGLLGFLLWAETIVETTAGVYAVRLSESQIVSVVIALGVVPVWIWKQRRDRRLGVPVGPLTADRPKGKVPAKGNRKGKR